MSPAPATTNNPAPATGPPSLSRPRRVVGWGCVTISLLIISFWAYWGILENFHEGWFYRSFWKNLVLGLSQYMSWMIGFMILALLSVRLPRVGAALHILLAIAAVWIFDGLSNPTAVKWFIIPPILLAAGYAWGRPHPRRLAYLLLIIPPFLITIGFGIEPALRVPNRHDDGDRGARHITGNGVDLIWAPQGPGWPDAGGSWHDAVRICRHLNEDGTALADTPQDIWRLPTIEEAVRSQHRGGEPCGGRWDARTGKATYDRRPDKETPLWDPHTQVIYWWTSTEVSADHARTITYHGNVNSRPKKGAGDYLAFRAVKEPRPDPSGNP